MSDAINALLELRAKVEENRKILEKQEAALEVMEEMMGLGRSSSQAGQSGLKNANVPVVTIKKTLKEEIKDIVRPWKNQEFSVPQVYASLLNVGLEPKGNQPKARIAGILGELQTERFIIKTEQGKGGVPNKYKLFD